MALQGNGQLKQERLEEMVAVKRITIVSVWFIDFFLLWDGTMCRRIDNFFQFSTQRGFSSKIEKKL